MNAQGGPFPPMFKNTDCACRTVTVSRNHFSVASNVALVALKSALTIVIRYSAMLPKKNETTWNFCRAFPLHLEVFGLNSELILFFFPILLDSSLPKSWACHCDLDTFCLWDLSFLLRVSSNVQVLYLLSRVTSPWRKLLNAATGTTYGRFPFSGMRLHWSIGRRIVGTLYRDLLRSCMQ